MTPEEYRANPVPLNHFQKPELLLNYVLVDEGVPLIANSIVLEVTRKKLSTPEIYLGMSGQVPIAQSAVGKATGPDEAAKLWQAFHQHKAGIPELEPGGVELGASMFGNTEGGTFTYFVGGEAKSQASARGELVKWELPSGEYVVCKFEAESFTDLTSSALGKAMDYLFGTWLQKNNLTSQPFMVEKYLPLTQEHAAMEIWVIPEPLEASENQK
jgi:AraC family transcriptional regulator